MFGKLKNKLKEWTKNLSSKAEDVEEEITKAEEEIAQVQEEAEKTEKEIRKEKKEAEKEIKKEKKKVEEKEEKEIEKVEKEISDIEKEAEKAEKEAEEEIEKEKKEVEEAIEKEKKYKKEKKEEKLARKEQEKEKKLKKKEEKKAKKKDEEITEEIKTEEIKKPVEKIHEEVAKLPEIEEEKTITEIIQPEEEKVVEEPEKEPEKEKKSFFQKITQKVNKVKISEKDFDVYAEELEMLLIENNVALEVAEKIVKDLRAEIVGKEMLKKEIEGQIQEHFKDIIRDILIEPFSLIDKIKSREDKSKPYVILFCGINGTGKTTSIAKIAQQMKKNNLKPVLAAADTFRAASIEQIKKHAEKLDLKVIAHEYGSDPAAVGFDAIKYAEKNKLDVVLIDTAGRMHTEKNLMAQIEKVAKVTKPDTKIFVGESITGNDILEQVRSFDWAIQIDGIILTKADIDEKGGTALSVGYVTKKPILYLGTGQEYDEIEPFDKEKFIKKLGLDDE